MNPVRSSIIVATALIAGVAGASVYSLTKHPAASPPSSAAHRATAIVDKGQRDTAPPKPVQVSALTRNLRQQLGVDVYFVRNSADSPSSVEEKATRIMDYVVSLDANSVSISFPFHISGPYGDKISAEASTPTPAQIAMVVSAAAARGLRVWVRPLLDEQNIVHAGFWRGSIQPSSPAAWFASYKRFLIPYLTSARAAHASGFYLGVELDSLELRPEWTSLLTEARTDFGGQIAYSANWSEYALRQTPVPADVIGVDDYAPQPLADAAPQTQLNAAWTGWLRNAPGSRPGVNGIVLSEVGIPAQDGGYRYPGSWGIKGSPMNYTVQARWFSAACHAARSLRMAGIYFWDIDFDENPAVPPGRTVSPSWFLRRPGADAVKTCFATW